MITAKIKGLDKVNAAVARMPQAIKSVNKTAGKEAAKNILDVEGVKNYAPLTEKNRPGRTTSTGRAMGYYDRGRGWYKPTKNGYQLDTGDGKGSQKLGTKWYVKQNGNSTLVGNPATYAVYIHGDYQPAWAKQVGWKKLYEVAKDKFNETVAIYERHIDAAIKRLGL